MYSPSLSLAYISEFPGQSYEGHDIHGAVFSVWGVFNLDRNKFGIGTPTYMSPDRQDRMWTHEINRAKTYQIRGPATAWCTTYKNVFKRSQSILEPERVVPVRIDLAPSFIYPADKESK